MKRSVQVIPHFLNSYPSLYPAGVARTSNDISAPRWLNCVTATLMVASVTTVIVETVMVNLKTIAVSVQTFLDVACSAAYVVLGNQV